MNKPITVSQLKKYIDMLREFYYEKNGKETSIEFLYYMANELKKTNEKDWAKLLEAIEKDNE